MPFVIDDIAVAATEMSEVATETAEIAGDVAESSEIIGDGIGEEALVNEKAIDVGEAFDLSVPESTEIIGDGVGESSIDGDSPRKISTRNEGLEGHNHPETGVPYERKVVKTDTGEEVEGVFPQFESKMDVQLPEKLELASDYKQFAECNRQLKEKCDNDPEFRKQFTEDQLDDINNGQTPEGYTWHHSEEKGKMQLVKYETHMKTHHTGGRSIWGGGKR